MDIPEIEKIIKTFWNTNNIKDKIFESKKDKPEWLFLDGPPFVNGSPHHGHLLVSSIKDVFARYMSQKDYQINYQIGFDCHGLPLEQEAEKKVGKVSNSDSLEKLTIFNNECRDIISNCSEIWYDVLEKLGRRFYKDQTYYTSNIEFMKVIWWAFRKLWDLGLIYKSKKVMPYSPLCETPLSNFEATSNYQEKTDISIYIKFKIMNSNEYLLIWTTTPWSLFANQGVCVNPEFIYYLIEYKDQLFWIGDFADKLFSDYVIIKTVLGKDLINIEYEPIFKIKDYNNYKVYADTYIQNTSGTGLVHLAPLFGADDMRVMIDNKYDINELPYYIINNQIKFNIDYIINEINIKNKFVMDASTDIVIHLKKLNFIFKSEKIKHSYPYCWRTDYPLIYLATDAWFLNVKKIIPQMIENNKNIQWYPSHVGTDRFANWIKDAPDWCLSRNRVWGTPIPIWINDNDSNDMICIESIEELEKYTGNKYDDIHVDKIHNVTITIDGAIYRRTNYIFDCWLESGLAPLARFGYPKCKELSYPVDFITESLDQTRGWFYTLNVLSTALFNKHAFNKVIVSGLILDSNGKKMSKRLNNYTSPDNLINDYGADILRLYLVGSPASKGEPFSFKDKDLFDITKKLIPYYNAHLFLLEYSNNLSTKSELSNNKLDKWIINRFTIFANDVYTNMERLEITSIPNIIFNFIDLLTNSYIKLSRTRLKSNSDFSGLNTLLTVLYNFDIIISPFIPHLTEFFHIELIKVLPKDFVFYSLLLNKYCVFSESIHMNIIDINIINSNIINIDKNLLDGFYSINELLECVRNLRQKINKPIYYPLNNIELYTNNNYISEFSDIICSELNIKHLIIKSLNEIKKEYKTNKSIIGSIYKKNANIIINIIENKDNNYSYDNILNILHDDSNIVITSNTNNIFDVLPETYYYCNYIIEEKNNMIADKFIFYNKDNINNQSIVYLNKETSINNDIEADINIIKRSINKRKKDCGYKITDNLEIIVENSLFFDNNNDIYNLLNTKLKTEIKLVPMLNEYESIKLYTDIILKYSIYKKID